MSSKQLINLKYDHLKGDQAMHIMKKQGMLSGSKQAYENGITTQTEKILCSGNQTNPNIRLSAKEEEYVLSQLIQRNFDKRRGLSVFNSKSKRTTLVKDDKQQPPVGIYEHQFNQPGLTSSAQTPDVTSKKSPSAHAAKQSKADSVFDTRDVEIDMKKIARPYRLPADR